ncbi:MAG: HD domain-containing protein [Clostridiales bacterium]|nr:HD domain-containing protein [Clostridiales bacterium]
MLFYYETFFILSVCLTFFYVFMWHKHFDVHITLLYFLIPVCNLGYVALAQSNTLHEAILALRITFLGGCYSILFVMLTIFGLCHIPLKRIHRLIFFLLSTAVYAATFSIGRNPIFYKTIGTDRFGGITIITDKQFGIMHTVFYAMVIFYFLMSLAALIFSYRQRKKVSHKIIHLLFIPVVVSMIAFFGGRLFTNKIELIPIAYVFAQVMYLLIVYKIGLYDINDSGIDSLVEKGETGFISFDFKLCYLGSNQTAEKYFPLINEVDIDQSITTVPLLDTTAGKWIRAFQNDEKCNSFHYRSEGSDKVYQVDVNYLYDGRQRRGYQFFITDDTTDIQYIELLDKFTAELESEVQEKTENLVKMHDRLIVSMAAMVESRDNSTGGHIKRTSQGVRILIDEMLKETNPVLTPTFCNNVIKAAPMHDLGKIAVDDAVLRKPGRFTPEEFDKMKAHAPEGARIVDEILKDTDDKEFHRVAVNVAHYHHERWDGTGYPEKLAGEAIPLEARIMAIADVYDALVSKRVYKDSMSFEKTDSIIMEGMGTQFDPGLQRFYEAARPNLEAYYTSLDEKDS